MRKYIVLLFTLILCLSACAPTPAAESTPMTIEEPPAEETYLAVIESRGSYVWDTSFERPWSRSTYVVRATVTDIGEAYLRDGMTISENESDRNLLTKLQGIRLPITITVNEVFKGDIAVGDTHLLLEDYGAYAGYYVAPSYDAFEEGCEYILFIVESKRWDRSYTITQSTVKLNPVSAASAEPGAKDFDPATLSPLFDQYANAAELMADIRALGEE